MRLILIAILLFFAQLCFAGPYLDTPVIETSLNLDFSTAGSILYSNGSKNVASCGPMSGNSGKFLTTDGTTCSWTSGGGGSLTNVTSSDGSIDITNPTTTPDLKIHFPMVAPATGSASSPTFRFDPDTGMYSTGDGVLAFSTNSTQQLLFASGGSGTNTFSNSVTAPDFIYPTKNAHYFLAGPTSGSPAIPAFRALGAGDIPNSAIPFPMFAPQNVSYLGTAYCFDSDSCMDSSGDGEILFSANSQLKLHLSQNYIESFSNWTHNADLIITGNISAANYPPTGPAGYFATYDGSGSLNYTDGWQYDSVLKGLRAYQLNDVVGSNTLHNIEASWEIPADVSAGITTLNIDSHFDRNNSGFNLDGQADGVNISHRHEGSGHVNQILGMRINTQVGSSDGTADEMQGLQVNLDVQNSGIVDNATILRLDMDSTDSGISNNLDAISISSREDVGNNYNVISSSHQSNGPIGQDFRFLQMGNDASVGNNAAGSLMFQNGNVTKNVTGYGYYFNADAGDNSGTNLVGYDFNIQSGHSIQSNLTGFNFSNGSNVTGSSNNINVLAGNNNSTGYRFGGVSLSQTGNMDEEIVGFRFNSNGDARTMTGLDLNLDGDITDDVGGLRLNMQNVTSATNQVSGINVNMTSSGAPNVSALSTNGGRNSLNGIFNPVSGGGFLIGNYLAMNSEVVSGSPITGSEFLQTLLQSNMQLHDTIGSYPFGLGLTGTAIVNQLAIDSGVTQSDYRAFLFGASNPLGSGTLTEYVASEGLGFQSFGGSVSVGKKVMLRDAVLFGQGFCNGVSDCWVYQAQDSTAHNWFAGDLTLGGSTGLGVSNAKLTVNDAHIRVVQTTSTAGAANANAGTGATCTVNGTDHAGEIELVTGSIGWASGPQCDVTFDLSYDNAPNCVFSAGNSTAALGIANAFLPDTSTSGFSIEFVAPDIASNTYVWRYRCE